VLFSVFSLEAYLNEVGEARIPIWDIVEPKLNWQAKLGLICRTFNIALDFGASPFSTVKRLFDFRNQLAHGRTHEVHVSSTESMSPTWIVDYMEEKEVEKVRKDIRAIRKLIHALG
jgi:hypothetical protein